MPNMPARDISLYGRRIQEKAVIEKREMAVERCSGEAEGHGGGAGEGAAPEEYVITLNHNEHQDSTIYRFDKGCYLHFVPGPSLMGRKVFLYTNYVMDDKLNEKGEQCEFNRNQYYLLEWREDTSECAEGDRAGAEGGEQPALAGDLITDRDVCCTIHLQRAGAFHYYFVYESTESRVSGPGSGWFQVSPTLSAGGVELPAQALCVQTVLAKCLGELSRWEAALAVAHHAGYNMIHFTPVQELGASNSAYSISGHLQLSRRYSPPAPAPAASPADLHNLLTKLRNEWKMLSICDVVLNHVANETPWLWTEPSASYNCVSAPHLRPAALLDAALARVARRVAAGEFVDRGLSRAPSTPQEVEVLRGELAAAAAALRLHEMYSCDVELTLQRFRACAANKVPAAGGAGGAGGALQLAADPLRRRWRADVSLDRALLAHNVYRAGCDTEETRLAACCAELEAELRALNLAVEQRVAGDLRAAVDNVIAAVNYFRVQADGPRLDHISEKHPLITRYFTCPAGEVSLAEAEQQIWSEAGAHYMAHNGWLMDGDALQDFAAGDSRPVYLRRELVAWGDSVKLRYGSKEEDSPWVWRYMREYVELVAELFDGVRLDNCHSTPLHVAEHMLDAARRLNPDLFVAAELFTNSDRTDNIFVNRLGINALIREAQAAWDPREQGRLLHRFGGPAVGQPGEGGAGGGRRAARGGTARALLLDLTHDNPAPAATRSALDLLATAAVVAAAACASGSTRGYDELVPHQIHVVDEERLYGTWGAHVTADTGLMAARRELNLLHVQLARDGYSELYVDQLDEHVVAVTRHNPATRRSVLLLAHNVFRGPGAPREPPPLRLEGVLQDIALEMFVRPRDRPPHRPDPHVINGLDNIVVEVRRNVPLASSGAVRSLQDDGAHTTLALRPLPPGAVAVLRVAPRPAAARALQQLRPLLHGSLTDGSDPLGLQAALKPLDLNDFNVLLYRCDEEERDETGSGVYCVPGHGALCYAGLQGAAAVLEQLQAEGDLAHPLCDNLRAGDWLAEYTVARLQRRPRLQPVAAAYRAALQPLAALPRYLQPAYFAALHARLHAAVRRAALSRLAPARGSRLAAALALTSVQLLAALPSASLPGAPGAATMSAGLPHFSTGYARCWGRDTFVSLRGLLLVAGRAPDARRHLLGFAACLRHGLLPNLLDGGLRARYNCRDAVWWWLQAVQDYCKMVPDGRAILSAAVLRLFPTDEASGAEPAEQPLYDVIQEALERHFQGVAFRERGAGRQLDQHMTDQGFNVQIGVDPETGFPFGGNSANCGTWMDKMGSSERAGTRGRPASPRDGSAVELVGLAFSAVNWLDAAHGAGDTPHAGVARVTRDGGRVAWTWRRWADTLRRNFERHFWVPPHASAADLRPDLVHRRAIYKDSHGASQPWADYQLRCNFPIAMVVAPELFEPKHAWQALDTLERLLLGPLGVKTLDPADWNYRAEYDNADDSSDPSVAHGFNYHQGPEWVWPLGFYLRARLQFAVAGGRTRGSLGALYAALGPLAAELRGPWRGLPELTGPGGRPCAHSCRSQAWSNAAALDVLHDLRAARRALPLA